MTQRNQYEPWTQQEMAILRDSYPGIGTVGVSKLISRSRGAIKRVASLEGIKVSHEYRSDTATRINKTWERTDSMKKRIGDGHRKYAPFLCEVCGGKIAYHAKRCSSCRDRAKEKNPKWRGGITTLRRLVDQMLWPVWKYPVFSRDSFLCRKCGKGGNLHAHHLKKYTTIRDNVLSEHPELSLDNFSDRKKMAELIVIAHSVSDGQTLCAKCHKDVHRQKSGELRETLNAVMAHGNPQPRCSNVLEFVEHKAQRLMPEDAQSDKGNTSARSLAVGAKR